LQSCSRLVEELPINDPPTDKDALSPWIHDVFPTNDGRYIQFVAQNKLRCRTGYKQNDAMAQMAPQVALMQHISVNRVTINDGTNSSAMNETRYTRFICRFKPSIQETQPL
jgi:hypothetical protein